MAQQGTEPLPTPTNTPISTPIFTQTPIAVSCTVRVTRTSPGASTCNVTIAQTGIISDSTLYTTASYKESVSASKAAAILDETRVTFETRDLPANGQFTIPLDPRAGLNNVEVPRKLIHNTTNPNSVLAVTGGQVTIPFGVGVHAASGVIETPERVTTIAAVPDGYNFKISVPIRRDAIVATYKSPTSTTPVSYTITATDRTNGQFVVSALRVGGNYQVVVSYPTPPIIITAQPDGKTFKLTIPVNQSTVSVSYKAPGATTAINRIPSATEKNSAAVVVTGLSVGGNYTVVTSSDGASQTISSVLSAGKNLLTIPITGDVSKVTYKLGTTVATSKVLTSSERAQSQVVLQVSLAGNYSVTLTRESTSTVAATPTTFSLTIPVDANTYRYSYRSLGAATITGPTLTTPAQKNAGAVVIPSLTVPGDYGVTLDTDSTSTVAAEPTTFMLVIPARPSGTKYYTYQAGTTGTPITRTSLSAVTLLSSSVSKGDYTIIDYVDRSWTATNDQALAGQAVVAVTTPGVTKLLKKTVSTWSADQGSQTPNPGSSAWDFLVPEARTYRVRITQSFYHADVPLPTNSTSATVSYKIRSSAPWSTRNATTSELAAGVMRFDWVRSHGIHYSMEANILYKQTIAPATTSVQPCPFKPGETVFTVKVVGPGGSAKCEASTRLFGLTVLANPREWGVTQGSGAYLPNSQAYASVTPNYGYVFSYWQELRGGVPYRLPFNSEVRPGQRWLLLQMTEDITVEAVLKRQLFKVTMKTSAWGGGTAYSSLSATIYNNNTGGEVGRVWADSSAGPAYREGHLDERTFEFWVPYGDVVYYTGSALGSNDHTVTAWDGGSYHGRSVNVDSNWFTVDKDVRLTFATGTPLMVDLSGDGKADLLAGLEWRKLKVRRPSPNMGAYRSFDLDGTGKKEWEWVGKGDGLLVYTAGLKGTPTYKELFGTRTFDKTFKHGYEALATLDADGNGVLQGEELKDIGVWVDADSDAVAQTGEIRSAKDAGVSELSVKFEADADGNVSNTKGAKVGGRDVAVWDWISYAFPKTLPDNEVARIDWTDKAPPAEFFKVEAQQGLKPIKMLPGGTLRVYRINDQLYVRATAKVEEKGDKVMDVLYPAEATSDGLLRWGMQGLANTLMASGPDLYGLTLAGENQYGLWSAKLISGNMANIFENR